MPLKVLTILGTRPEAIKLAPVINAMRRAGGAFDVRVCLTGQHRELLQNLLPAFGIRPDEDLDSMLAGQTLCESTARILAGLQGSIVRFSPDLVLVQGDTTTTFCGALAAFYSKIPVAHVEAGLRTGDLHSPFPEEINRTLVTRLASFHFAATAAAAENLYAEGVPAANVWITGNTGIDAIAEISTRLKTGAAGAQLPIALDPSRKLILVTAHRRENFPAGLEGIFRALRDLAQREDVQIVFPIHPNPNVRAMAMRMLPPHRRIHLIDPLEYTDFVELMRRSHLILSDSGGIQEEAPALGKPVLILRDTTERPEAVSAGASCLVGTSVEQIVDQTTKLLDDSSAYAEMATPRNVYGDGQASERICAALLSQRAGLITPQAA